MERRRQAIFYFIAAGLFGFAFFAQLARHGLGAKTLLAALLTGILLALGLKARREDEADPER
jgi:hypothetical protein